MTLTAQNWFAEVNKLFDQLFSDASARLAVQQTAFAAWDDDVHDPGVPESVWDILYNLSLLDEDTSDHPDIYRPLDICIWFATFSRIVSEGKVSKALAVDFTQVHNLEGFHDELARAFGLFDGYERNLDALGECLRDIQTDASASLVHAVALSPHEVLEVRVTIPASDYAEEALTMFATCMARANAYYLSEQDEGRWLSLSFEGSLGNE